MGIFQMRDIIQDMLKKILWKILILAIIAAAVWSFYNYHQTKQKVAALTDPEAQSDLISKERDALIKKVSEIILLPEDEDPSIALVSDVETLRANQPFFRNSENGDQVLVYTDRAIIYRKSEHKIINIGPVTGATAPPEIATANEENIPVSVENKEEVIITVDIRNGSGVSGVAGALGKKLESNNKYEIINIGDAERDTYVDTLLINPSNLDVSSLEEELGISSTDIFPSGVKDSTADIVIIIGKE